MTPLARAALARLARLAADAPEVDQFALALLAHGVVTTPSGLLRLEAFAALAGVPPWDIAADAYLETVPGSWPRLTEAPGGLFVSLDDLRTWLTRLATTPAPAATPELDRIAV